MTNALNSVKKANAYLTSIKLALTEFKKELLNEIPHTNGVDTLEFSKSG